ncbi:hypothetical protein N0V90_004127 [Kalmusia sp. IMI 367209]|nr:hypothetical protein N0V90_004127 [Kalmusia sp. IMI 367209]
MYIRSSLLASAVVLSFSTHAIAGVTQQDSNAERVLALEDETEHQGLLQRWPLNKVFGKRQEAPAFTALDVLAFTALDTPAFTVLDAPAFTVLECPTDDLYIEILDGAPSTAVQTFCNRFLDIPPATVTVAYTATITNFTSETATSTQTVQVLTTETVTETATITPAAVLRRAADMVAQFAVANEIFAQVIAQGTEALAASTITPNGNRDAALSGFENACSCETVAPLSTITITDTVLTQRMTVGKNKLRVLTVFVTKSYTTTTTITPGIGQTANANTTSTTVPASITSPASIALIASGSVPPISSPSAPVGPGVPVVIGIPFECPKDGVQDPQANGLSPQFIVGDLRYEYSVLCDTAIDQSNPLFGVQGVANQTACAAQCSIVNNAAQKQLCESATFLPNPGASDGQCFLHGPVSRFVKAPGSTTILLTGVSSKSDKCTSVDLVNGSGNTTVDTAQLIGNALTSGFSISTPGLVTRSETGGVFKTYFSSGYTRSDGYYFYSWFEIYASSSAWWAAYATSWSCTAKNAPQTIVIQQTVENKASVFVDVTTIVNGSITTVISGTSTFSIIDGAGSVPPSLVPALVTEGGIVLTTGYSTLMSNATAGAGVEGPAPTLIGSGPLIPLDTANQTVVVPNGSEGSIVVTLAGEAATSNFTAGGGVIAPSATSVALSAGSAAITVSGSTLTFNASEGNGSQPGVAQPSGANQFTIAGTLVTGFSIGGAGFIPPSPTNGSFVGTLPSASSLAGGLEGSTASSSAVFVLPLIGYGSPTSSAAAILPGNSTVIAEASGAIQVTVSGEASIANLTGGASAIPPPLVTAAISVGIVGFNESGATATAFTAQGSGVIPPVPSNITLVGTGGQFAAQGTAAVLLSIGGGGSGIPPPPAVNSTQLPVASTGGINLPLATGTGSPVGLVNGTSLDIGPTAGAANFTVFGGTAVTSATEGFGLIPPAGTAPASQELLNLNSSLPSGTAAFAISGATAITIVASGNGIVPPSVLPSASANTSIILVGTAPASSGGLNVSIFEATAVVLSTGTGGVALPLINLTTSVQASLVPSPSTNASSINEEEFSNSLRDRTGRPITRTSSSLGTAPLVTAPIGTGSSVPMVNSTSPPLPPIIPNFAYGAKTSSLESSAQQFSAAIASFSANSSEVFPTASGSVTIPPLSANSSVLLPTVSSSPGPNFSNSDNDRLGRPRPSTARSSGLVPAPSSNVTLSGTAPVQSANISFLGTAVIVVQSANVTLPSSAVLLPSVNYSGPLVTAPSDTGPSSIPSTGNFSALEAPRSGSISRVSANSTAFLPTGTAPASSIAVAVNSSAPIGTASGPVPLNTAASASIVIFSATANFISAFGTGGVFATGIGASGTGSTGFQAASINSTFAPLLATAPSITPTLSLNSSVECPTATPVIVPHTTVITTVSYETLLVEASTCAPSATSIFNQNVTLPTGTGLVSVSTPSATSLIRSYRRSGEIATQEQIDQACADHSNIVINPDFSFEAANTAFGWTTKADDAAITFHTANAATTQTGRVLAAAAGRSLTISQPLTLCPGKQYRLTSSNRQANLLSKCTAEYLIGDDSVYTASPQETFLKRDANFMAGNSPEEVSKDLTIRCKCDGEDGIPAGANEDGFMVVEVDDVSVQQV